MKTARDRQIESIMRQNARALAKDIRARNRRALAKDIRARNRRARNRPAGVGVAHIAGAFALVAVAAWLSTGTADGTAGTWHGSPGTFRDALSTFRAFAMENKAAAFFAGVAALSIFARVTTR